MAALTGSTPYSLIFNRAARQIRTADGERPAHEMSPAEWKQWQDRIISIIYPAIDERVKSMNAKTRKAMDKHRRTVRDPIEPGTVVWLKDQRRGNKWEGSWVGPYTVSKRTTHGAYMLRDGAGSLLERPITLDQLKITSIDPSSVDNVYEVEQIFDHRRRADGVFEFFTRWKDYGPEHDEWLAEDKFNDTQIIRSYWKKLDIDPDSLQQEKEGKKKRRGKKRKVSLE